MMRSKSWLLKISPTLTLILKLCKMDDEMPFFILFFFKKKPLIGWIRICFVSNPMDYIYIGMLPTLKESGEGTRPSQIGHS